MCGPGALSELQATEVTVAGVDRPVAARLAAGHLIPFPVGGRGRLSGHGDAAATEYCAGKGDLGDADVGCGGLTVASTHTLGNSSRYTPTRSAVGFGLDSPWRGSPGRGRTSANDVGFTPRSRMRLRSDLGGPGGSPASIRGRNPSPTGWSSACYRRGRARHFGLG